MHIYRHVAEKNLKLPSLFLTESPKSIKFIPCILVFLILILILT